MAYLPRYPYGSDFPNDRFLEDGWELPSVTPRGVEEPILTGLNAPPAHGDLLTDTGLEPGGLNQAGLLPSYISDEINQQTRPSPPKLTLEEVRARHLARLEAQQQRRKQTQLLIFKGLILFLVGIIALLVYALVKHDLGTGVGLCGLIWTAGGVAHSIFSSSQSLRAIVKATSQVLPAFLLGLMVLFLYVLWKKDLGTGTGLCALVWSICGAMKLLWLKWKWEEERGGRDREHRRISSPTPHI